MVVGLLHVNASIWMLLRGGGIVFVALMKHFVLQARRSAVPRATLRRHSRTKPTETPRAPVASRDEWPSHCCSGA